MFAAMDVVYNAFLVLFAFCKKYIIYFYVLFFADNPFNFFKKPCFKLQLTYKR